MQALLGVCFPPRRVPIAKNPTVRTAPGFIAGYRVDPVDPQGFGFLLFDTEEHALKATPPATSWSAPGVTILRADVRRVAVALP